MSLVRKRAADKERRTLLKFILALAGGILAYPLANLFKAVPKKRKESVVIFEDIQELNKPMIKNGVWLVKNEDKIFAFPNRCTHLGCPLNFVEDKFVCKCHGSRFDIRGKKIMGPAKRDLPRLHVFLTNDGKAVVKL